MDLTDEEANRLQDAVSQFIDKYHKYPSRLDLEDMVAQLNHTAQRHVLSEVLNVPPDEIEEMD
jgi:hypothetical protein